MQQQQHTLALMLSQPELPTFAGDPIKYCSFIRAFESLIESRTDSSSTRLYYLVQYMSSDAHELMCSCLSMNHTEGYHEVRQLLKEHYGQNYKIATTYVDRVTMGPQIRAEKTEDLRKFSTLITSCKNALRDIGYLNRINNPDCLKNIVDRLPFDMKHKCCDIADDISESKRREITIEDNIQFIEKKARSASHPIFGNISSPNTSNQGKQQKLGNRSDGSSGRRLSFGISGEQKGDSRQGASRNRPQCPLCNTNHWLSQCSEFRSKSLDKRLKVIRAKGLCNNCLVSGHVVRECPKESFCNVEGCKSKHSTFLHQLNDNKCANPKQGEKKEETQGSHKQPNTRHPKRRSEQSKWICKGKGRKPQVPKDHNKLSDSSCEGQGTKLRTDSDSNTTFCTEELMEQLQAIGTETTLSLTTLGIEDNANKTSVPSQQVSDLDENNLIELPLVFSTPWLPVTTNNRANHQDLRKWPHLQGIDIIDIDADIGLLIGSDIPRALEPGEPYATKTELGWVVNGPLTRSGSSQHTTNPIKTDADLSVQFKEYCNMEFNDSCYDSNTAMSREDKRALEKMRASIRLKNGHYEIDLL